MANKPLQFVLIERKLSVGPQAGKIYQVARPTGRHRVDFRSFCERVAKSTAFNRQEVEAVLNYATEIARDIVANGDIVEFGDLGTLKPSFKSKAVPKGKTFRAQEHIEKPVVLLNPSYLANIICVFSPKTKVRRLILYREPSYLPNTKC